MIKIISGFGGMGGSTIAFVNLVNLFNKNGHDAILYAPENGSPKIAWHLDKCKSEKLDGTFLADYYGTPRQSQLVLKDYNILNEIVDDDDILICHLLPLYREHHDSTFELVGFDTSRLKKVIYACHETDVYPVSNINPEKFDLIHYVSEGQRDWHHYNKVPNVVIPNVLSPLKKQKKTIEFKKVGGVIGTIGEAKRTHVAIKAALDDGCDKVLVFGGVDQFAEKYWEKHMSPLLKDETVMCVGRCDDKSLMYSDLDVVYHASKYETFNYIEKECAMLDIPYIHTDVREAAEVSPLFDAEAKTPTLVSDKEIMKMWEKVFDKKRDS